jgi:hypothetical protein
MDRTVMLSPVRRVMKPLIVVSSPPLADRLKMQQTINESAIIDARVGFIAVPPSIRKFPDYGSSLRLNCAGPQRRCLTFAT